jgi:hypothetical protein
MTSRGTPCSAAAAVCSHLPPDRSADHPPGRERRSHVDRHRRRQLRSIRGDRRGCVSRVGLKLVLARPRASLRQMRRHSHISELHEKRWYVDSAAECVLAAPAVAPDMQPITVSVHPRGMGANWTVGVDPAVLAPRQPVGHDATSTPWVSASNRVIDVDGRDRPHLTQCASCSSRSRM